ncbi:MAG: DUF4446 family protein [Lachnospiraceae bacterium]|nr:DUF4446 family protein [Lachnospiraceae bacterium]
MSSALFESIGLGSIDPAYFFIGLIAVIFILLILLIVQIAKTNKLKKRFEKFMQGKDGGSLEEEISNLFQDISSLKEISDSNSKEIKNLYKRMRFTYQKLGIVKYDAFKQMGGMLSFSLALLNEDNDGFIINSVHSSDGCYSYTKEITKGECALALGEEEKQALDMAMGNE